MPADYRERAFETAIEDQLLAHGYARGVSRDHDATAVPEGFDREQALFPGVFGAFVRESQPETWKALEKLHATNTAAVLLDELCKNLDSRGCLDVIRHG